MARHETGAFGRIAGLFGAAFLAGVVVLAMLGYFGLPEPVLGTILTGATLATFVFLGASAGTIETSQFFLAGRALPTPVNGIAGATAVLSGTVFLGLAGAYFSNAETAAAFSVGLALGILILAVAIAPYFRKSGAFGVADFLGIRFGGKAVRTAAAGVVVVALLPALAAAVATAGELAAPALGVTSGAALAVVLAVILAATAIGGMRGVTRTAVVQYIVLALAFLAPVVVVSVREYSLPLPQLTFGYALKEAGLLVLASGRDLAAALPAQLLALGPAGSLTIMLSVATGVAVLPHLLIRNATVAGVDHARRSAGWTLFFVLAVVLAAPAYAAFTRLVLLREVADSSIDALPDWFFTFGAAGLINACGQAAVSAIATFAACGTNALPADQLAISGDMVVLGAPSVFDLPFAFSALTTLGALAAALAAASAMAIAIANALGHDLYGAVIDARASAGRRLIVTRLALVATVGVSAWLGVRAQDDVLALSLSAISLSAGGLFPATILAIWWKRANAAGAVAAILAGGIVTAIIVAGRAYPDPVIPGPLDWLGLSDLTGALAGVIVGFITMVAVSLATGAPDAESLALLAAIRRPGGAPFVQESESQ